MIQLIFLFVIISGIFTSDLNESTSCVTPNQQNGSCIALIDCDEIADILFSSPEAFKFAKASQCGSGKGMVCCGPMGYLKSLETRALVTSTPAPLEILEEKISLSKFSDPSVCGLHAPYRKIKGGRVTEFDEFPWVVALEYVSKYDHTNAGIRCGGSLISNNYVLTAAHCIVHVEFAVIKAWFGATNISTDENCLNLTGNRHCVNSIQKRNINETLPNPLYNILNNYHDIGLLKLDHSIEFNDYIRPICLPWDYSVSSPIRTYLTVAGWGSTENSTTSDIKLRVDLPVQNDSVCTEILKNHYRTFSSEQLCVGGEVGKDSCQGDSGGPLMKSFRNANGDVQWVQEGIVSYGVGCGVQGRPGIYIKVSSYIPWIIQQIFKLNRGTPCVTPNGELVTCISLRACTVIMSALRDRKLQAIQFAQQSQCGYDIEPLVCCGSTGYPTKIPEVIQIFPNVSEPENQDKTRTEQILLSFTTKSLPDKTVCGFAINHGNGSDEVASIGEFPWIVALEYKSRQTGESVGIKCGGTLINNRYVLTAASCILDIEFEITKVWLGDWNIAVDPDCHQLVSQEECADEVQKIEVKTEIPHPFYSKKSGNNDIGLLRLEHDVKFTDYIRPICLPPANLPIPAFGTNLTVAGWGATENGTSSDIKLKVQVPLLSTVKCKDKRKKGINAHQLCAGGERGKDSCQGDYGGPLMRTYEEKVSQQSQWYQEGVVSYGVGCGPVDYQAIYTRVNRYTNWIINNIKTD